MRRNALAHTKLLLAVGLVGLLGASSVAGPGTLAAPQATAAGAIGGTFTAAQASSGLVAAYGFEEGSGLSVADSSGYSHTGTISGATWTAGKNGNALSFDGTNDWVTIADTNVLDLTTAVTLEAWVNLTVNTNWRAAIYKERDVYYLYASTSTNRPAMGSKIGGSYRELNGPSQLATGSWVHLAGTYDGTTQRLYVNGTQVASRAQTGAVEVGSGPLRIGGNATFGESFGGTIDDVRVYNRALTAAEIQADMNTPVGGAGSTPPPTCTPNWTCTTWSACSSGTQTRTCTDANSCGTSTGKPAESQSCTVPTFTITAPTVGTTITGSSVAAAYTTTGDLTGADHVHLQFDNEPEVRGLGFAGTYTFTNVAAGTHTIRGYVARADHTTLPNAEASQSVTVSVSASTTPPPCTPSWQCTAWSACSTSGTQTRTCTDANSCGTSTGKPAESQSCSVTTTVRQRLQPADLVYQGAFRFPSLACGTDNQCWEYGARSITYYPGGDPAGSADGYPGSLFGVNHQNSRKVAELSIPAPVNTRTYSALPTAATLQPFSDIRDGVSLSSRLDLFGGLAFIPAQGAQLTDLLYWSWYEYYMVSSGGDVASVGTSGLDLTRTDDARGAWHVGPYGDAAYHPTRTSRYLLTAPADWANQYTGGKTILGGKSTGQGTATQSQGPTLVAFAPVSTANPPATGAALDAQVLVSYPYPQGATDFAGYTESDFWTGGAWVRTPEKEGVVLAGFTGNQTGCYGEAYSSVRQQNSMTAVRFTMPNEQGTTRSMSVYVRHVDAAPNNQFQLAVYADAGGSPGALVASGPVTTLQANSWNTVTLPAATLSPNATYWLAYNTNGSGLTRSGMKLYAGATNQMQWRSQPFGSWPSSFGAVEGRAAYVGYIHVSYLAGGVEKVFGDQSDPNDNTKSYCYDTCQTSKGYHNWPYETHYVFYDPVDLAKVAQGQLAPNKILPYATYTPTGKEFWNSCGSVGGVTYDQQRSRLFVVEPGGGSYGAPITHVYQVSASATPPPTCTSNWTCTAWSACSTSGTQTRTCTDTNNCGVTTNRPPLTQSCTATPPPSTKFVIGDRVTVTADTANLNVRSSASLTATLLGTQVLGALGTVTAGPTAADGTSWWQINYDTAPDGWSIEDHLEKTRVITNGSLIKLATDPKVYLIENTTKRWIVDEYTFRTLGYTDSQILTVTQAELDSFPTGPNLQLTCTPNWSCTAWSACSGGSQTRACTDTNSCGNTTGKPAESQSCTVAPPPSPTAFCQPLPAPTGTVTTVAPSQASQLPTIIANAAAGTTIVLQDGTYSVPGRLRFTRSGVTLRSQSGNRSAVVLDANYNAADGEIIAISAADVTIADLTLRKAWFHPIHITSGGARAKLHNLHILDARQQFVKINAGNNDGGELACSTLEMSDAGRTFLQANPTPNFLCYTGGLDAHVTNNWVVRDNTIRNIYCTNGGVAEHGIHFWNGGSNPTIERNVLINNARGIGLGLLGSGISGGTIRNNFIYADIANYDSGIGIEDTAGAQVLHNTVYSTRGTFNVPIDLRGTLTTGTTVVRNNLHEPAISIRNGATPTLSGNVRATAGMFANLVAGDLHLLAGATAAINRGVSAGVTQDIDGEARDASPDVGADEHIATPPPTCTPSWQCTTWSACSTSGTQTRTCTDANSCGVTTNKPAESQSCTVTTGSNQIPWNEFTYAGSLAIPPAIVAGVPDANSGYSLAVTAYHPAGNGGKGSLFISGHNYRDEVAEFSIPEILGNQNAVASLVDLPVASVLQPFANIAPGYLGLNLGTADDPQRLNELAGMTLAQPTGSTAPWLMWSLRMYYNQGPRTDLESLGAARSLTIASPQAVGIWGAMNQPNNRFAGYLATVPQAFADQHLDGRTVLSGKASGGGVQLATTSYGPAAFAVKPWDSNGNPAVDRTKLSAIPLVYYPPEHPLPGWQTANRIEGMTWVRHAGRDALAFIGVEVTNYCYGTGEACQDPCFGYQGFHGYPYSVHAYLYSSDELLRVVRGELQPWEARPYQNVNLTSLGVIPTSCPGSFDLEYDFGRNRLFITQASIVKFFANTASALSTPAVHVFSLGATPPPTCTPSWQCTTWSACSTSGTQTRTCTDANACGTSSGKPAESQSCTVATPPTVTVTSPADGATLTGPSVSVRYATAGDRTGVDHVHLILDSQPEVRDVDFDGTYTFPSVSPGTHTVVVYLAQADHRLFSQSTAVAQVRFTVSDAPTCTPSWQCTTWSACHGGTQTRTCTDANACGTSSGKPAESQSCKVSDTKGPSIGNLKHNKTATSATITWTTDEPASDTVEYNSTAISRGAFRAAVDSATALSGTLTFTLLVTDHAVTIDNLAPATTYAIKITSTDEAGNSTVAPSFTFTTDAAPPLPDTLAPVVSSVAITQLTTTGAVVSWVTDEPSSSQVAYGPTPSYDSQVTDGRLTTAHQLTLTGLQPDTTYHYQVSSADAAGNPARSAGLVFTTQVRPLDTDGDGVLDADDVDDDNDTILDVDEVSRGTNPRAADTDSDGVADAADAFPADALRHTAEPAVPSTPLDTDADGVPDTSDSDDDADGLSDDVENNTTGTSTTKADTDGDGVNDRDDAYPLNPAVSARPEVRVDRAANTTSSTGGGGGGSSGGGGGSSTPVRVPVPTPTATPPRGPATLPEGPDSDGDGLSDIQEARAGTDRASADTDGDGYSDHTELQHGFDPFTPPLAKPLAPATLARLRGRILLLVSGPGARGQAFWLRPTATGVERTYLRDGDAAYALMRRYGQGIDCADLAKIPLEGSAAPGSQTLQDRFKGQILINVKCASAPAHGEAYYVDPTSGKRTYLPDGPAAYQLLRAKGLGATSDTLRAIPYRAPE